MNRAVLFILLTAFYITAALVPLEKAKKVAENYYGHYCAEAASKGSSVIYVQENKYEGIITRYTFEFDKGFVIVTANDELYPILGYSDHGKVPKADIPGGQNFKEWFDNYDRQIACKGSGKYIDEAAVKLWKDIENNVFPAGKAGIIVDRLVKAQWGQLYPWNLFCPEKDSMETYAGCVATAMAQILRYHRWPDVGVGSASYLWEGQTLTADFTAHTWNYDLMPEVLDIEYGIYPEYWETGITQAEKNELSLLSYWTGLSVDMSYGTLADNGSWAYAAPVDDSFLDHWKASSSVYYTMETPPAAGVDAQFATIKAELDAKRPWFWAGGAHAFLLDGYRDDYWYHFNWGWEGNYDGWFHRSSLIPGGVGSCDTGGGDFTAGQLGITYVPSTNPYTSWPSTTLSGSLVNGEDASLSWTACAGATGYKIFRTFSSYSQFYNSQAELLVQTTGLTYSDNDLSEGYYSYYIVAVYASGESHNSNSFTTSVAEQAGYPIVKDLTASVVGRTNIDLSWTKPFVGILNSYITFDPYGVIPSDWRQENTDDALVGQSVWLGQTDYDTIFPAHEDDYSGVWHDGPLLIGRGYFMIIMTTTAMNASFGEAETRWFLSPSITFNSGHTIKWWNRFRYTDDAGVPVTNRPLFQIVSYAGSFTETRRESNIIYSVLATFDGDTGSPENIWAYEENVSLAALAGFTTRVGIRVPVDTTDMYSLAFDNITVGSSIGGGDAPTGYEIYRNGSLATTISGSTTVNWSDMDFTDGDNTYYIKALYPTGYSVPCPYVTATIDANPKPGYLTGIGGTTVQLSWYAPYHNSPKWYCNYDPANSTKTIDVFGSDICSRRRTLFKAEDLGFYYPVTLDSVGVGFYDWEEGNWNGNNTFTIRILTGGTGAISDTIYTSSTCTAVHNQIYYHKLASPIILNEPWNVEVTTNNTGYPGTLAGKSNTGSTHSFYYNSATSSYNYGMSVNGTGYEWAHMSYVTSSAPPPIAKSGTVAPSSDMPVKGIEADITKSVKVPVTNPKALDYYRIYRDGAMIGTSTTTNFSDSNLPASADYTYYVTAYYVNPVGESDWSNEVMVYGDHPPPPCCDQVIVVPSVNITLNKLTLNWNSLSEATGYYIYSSTDPYGTFILESTVLTNFYETDLSAKKKFYYVVATNEVKREAPGKIRVEEKNSDY